jgi:hypothetical protein
MRDIPFRAVANTLVATSLLVFGALASPSSNKRPLEVSMIAVLANPQAFDGKLIRVSGYCSLGFGDNGLYLHREDFQQALFKNGLWLDVEWPLSPTQTVNNRYVTVQGVVDAHRQGHLSLWAAEIRDVRSITPHPSRSELRPPPRG